MKKNKKIVSLFLATILTLGIMMPLSTNNVNAENVANFSQQLSESGVTSTKVYVKTSSAKMRKGHTVKSKLITTLKYGEHAKLIYVVSSNKYLTNAWAYVNYNGQKGYISMKNLMIDQNTTGVDRGISIDEYRSRMSNLGFNYYNSNTYVYGRKYNNYSAGICTFLNNNDVIMGYVGGYKSSKFASTLKKSVKLLVPTKANTIYKRFLHKGSKPKYILYVSDGKVVALGTTKVGSTKFRSIEVYKL